MNIRTEKAIKAVIARGDQVSYRIEIRKLGNHSISFYGVADEKLLAKFTLQSIIGKRLKKRKVK
jgi:hypothetical protein